MSKIHYGIYVGGRCIWDGQTPCPPRVGEAVVVENRAYSVVSLRWEAAGAAMGDYSARAWGHGAGDHAYVSIFCEEAKGRADG